MAQGLFFGFRIVGESVFVIIPTGKPFPLGFPAGAQTGEGAKFFHLALSELGQSHEKPKLPIREFPDILLRMVPRRKVHGTNGAVKIDAIHTPSISDHWATTPGVFSVLRPLFQAKGASVTSQRCRMLATFTSWLSGG